MSPIRVDRLAHHLAVIGYPKDKTEYLIQGFTHGFFLGDPFDSEASDIAANNSKMASDHPEVVEMKLEQEINAGRISGPHTSPPFSPFQISPLNVREKSTPGKYRLIHDLSYPYNDESINSKIPDHLKSVKYSSVRDTMATLSRLPKGVYMAKCDIADAYRIIPLHPSEYPKLGMMWKGQYYFDKYLPQGCGSSCRIFEAFSTALEAIFKFYNPVGDVQHMIDDFLFIALTFKKCDALLKAFTQLCDDIGVPLAPHKTTVPDVVVIFLGILLNSLMRTASLPGEKTESYVKDIEVYLNRRKVTQKELQSIVGKLNFAAAVVPARPFLFRLIQKIYSVHKPHHKIWLTCEMKEDLKTWLQFLREYNGVTLFRALKLTPSHAINLGSDASLKGLGACFENQWIQAAYSGDWIGLPIHVLELYPLLILINMFGEKLRNKSVLFLCDNRAVVDIIKSQSSACPRTMKIMRPLTLNLIKFNIYLTSEHIPGKQNVLPDLISRFKVTKQILQSFKMRLNPTPIPWSLLPENFDIGSGKTCQQPGKRTH